MREKVILNRESMANENKLPHTNEALDYHNAWWTLIS